MYDFSNLSPLDFEHLVADLMSAEMNVRFKYYKAGADGGIDTQAYVGKKRIVIQAKRYIESKFSDLLKICKEEAEKWSRRSDIPDEFWLATTLPLLPQQAADLANLFTSMPIDESKVLGLHDIEGLLKTHTNVARSHVKLWLGNTDILDRIIHSGVTEYSDFERQEINETASTYVTHRGFDNGLRMLTENGSLVISGPPGIGKTTMAHMLALDHTLHGWEVMFVQEDFEAGDAVKSDQKRLIFFDDFLGQITLTNDSIRHSDSRINNLISRATKDPNLRFMMTSRDYILEDAHQKSEKLNKETFKNRKYVLQLKDYSKLQRAHILYNHLYAAGLAKGTLEEVIVSKAYKEIIDHPNFTPRLIETMTTRYTGHNSASSYVKEFLDLLDNPERQWSIPYDEHFRPSDRLLLIAHSFFSSRRRGSPTLQQLKITFLDLRGRLGFEISSPQARNEFRKALVRMDGGLIQISDGCVRSTNPGATEFMQGRLESDGHILAILESNITEQEIQAIMWALQARKRTLPESETLLAILSAIELLSQDQLSPNLAVVAIWSAGLVAKKNTTQSRLHTLIAKIKSENDDDWPLEHMETIVNWASKQSKVTPFSAELKLVFMDWLEAESLKIIPFVENNEIEIDDADAFFTSIICSDFSSPVLIKIGALLTESAIFTVSADYTVDSNEDASDLIASIQHFASEYDINVHEAIRDIEDVANEQWARDDHWEQVAMDARLSSTAKSSSGIERLFGNRLVEADEDQIVTEMFKKLT